MDGWALSAPAEDEEADRLEGDGVQEPPEAALGLEGLGRFVEDSDVLVVYGEEGAVCDQVWMTTLAGCGEDLVVCGVTYSR